MSQVTTTEADKQFESLPFFRKLELAPDAGARWFRFRLRNSSPNRQSLIVELDLKGSDLLQSAGQTMFYSFDSKASEPPGKAAMSTSVFPLATAFALDLAPGQEKWVYLKMQPAIKISFTLELWPAKNFNEEIDFRRFAYGLFFGAMLIMAFYNLSLMFILKDLVYLYYVGYVSGLSAYLFVVSGHFDYYIWPNVVGVGLIRVNLALGGATLFATIQFARTFLRSRELLPAWDKILFALLVGCAAYIPLSFFLPLQTSFDTLAFALVLACPLALATGALGWNLTSEAKYFTISWVTLILGISASLLVYFSVLPANAFTSYTIHMGAVCEAGLLSFALAHRINKAQQEKTAMHAELLNTQKVLNEELEQRVNERTRELSQLNSQLVKLSSEDGLTGLFNRRHFDEALAIEHSKAQTSCSDLALIMGDIDYFKNFNDHYGHQAGDQCLQQVATIFQVESGRDRSIAARYGGEEFVLLLPATDLEDAMAVANQIRKAVANLNINHEKSLNHSILTISLGVVSRQPDKDMSRQSLIEMADRALYKSKTSGRNQVSV